jgi:selenocysteine-specific elongation factor
LAELDRRGPLPVKTLVNEGALPTATAASALAALLKGEEVFILSDPKGKMTATQLESQAKAKVLISSRAGWAALLSQIKTTLAGYHDRFPLRVGMPRSELKSRLKLETRLFNEALKRGQADEAVIATESSVRLADHKVIFGSEQQVAIDKLLATFRRTPYNTPLPKDVAATLGDEVMLALIEGGRLIRLSNEVILLTATYDEFVDWLKQYLHKNKTVTVAQVRDVFKTSRKYALALLEYTDEQHLTKRVGDERILRE